MNVDKLMAQAAFKHSSGPFGQSQRSAVTAGAPNRAKAQPTIAPPPSNTIGSGAPPNFGHRMAAVRKAKPKATVAKAPMIQPSHKGRLHRALGVPEGQPIPAAKLATAKASPNPHMRQMATFAENAKGFAHPSPEVHVHIHLPSDHDGDEG